jgi:hypothetical protein
VPEKQTPEIIPPELDPSLRGHETEDPDSHNETGYDEHTITDQSSSPSGPAGPDKVLEDLLESEPDDDIDDNYVGTTKSKKKRLRKRLYSRRKKAVKSLSGIFAESRKRQKNYQNTLKDSFHEGKRKAHQYKETKRNKAKRRTRIINAIKRSRARNNE